MLEIHNLCIFILNGKKLEENLENVGFEKQNQRMLDHIRIQQMTNMLCEKILSDIKMI